jgi:hypothetical protein
VVLPDSGFDAHSSQSITFRESSQNLGLNRSIRESTDDVPSIITLFNSETDSMAVMEYAAKRLILGASVEQALPNGTGPNAAGPDKDQHEWNGWIDWAGNYYDADAHLAIVVRQDKPHRIQVNYGGHDEGLKLTSRTYGSSKYMAVTYRPDDSTLSVQRRTENRIFIAHRMPTLDPVASVDAAAYIGEYYSADIDSTMHITGSGSVLYAAFDGFLGKGPVHTMRNLGKNVWWMSCFRSLDAPSPGYWTVAFFRTNDVIDRVIVGCSIARKVEYVRRV